MIWLPCLLWQFKFKKRPLPRDGNLAWIYSSVGFTHTVLVTSCTSKLGKLTSLILSRTQ